MARPIVLSNGSLHVGINYFGMVHDFYYPWVGLENHATANNMRHRIGIWTQEGFSWLDDGTWEFRIDYEPRALIGNVQARNKGLGVTLELQDCVDADDTIFMRNVHVINEWDRERDIRLFMHQVFRISNSMNGGTVQYLPTENALLHYKGHRAFVIGAIDSRKQPFDQFSVGLYGIEGKEGTYRDAEDGQLEGNVVEHGSVDSVLRFGLRLAAHDSTRVGYWIVAAQTQREAVELHRTLLFEGIYKRLAKTQAHWHTWLTVADPTVATLPVALQDQFRKSLLIIKSHIDRQGAVIASTDTTMRNYMRDAYAYCWPRDGAYSLWPLLRLGYLEEVKMFFRFCRGGLHPDGYLQHKYQADGALGSSWHPYIQNGEPELPIQEDETALVVYLFGQYWERTKDKETLLDFYDTLIAPAANWMSNYIDHATKLPHASYDLWEFKFQTTTYTTALTYGALQTAAQLAEVLHKSEDAVRWAAVADDIREAAPHHLYSTERKFFQKGFIRRGEALEYDSTIDVSGFYGAFMFGLFDIDGPELTASLSTLRQIFGVRANQVTPLPRFERDDYYTAIPGGMGNPWFVTTLWLAEYYIQAGHDQDARQIIDWVQSRMLPSGVLSEQMHPATHAFISVAPLLWSQAEFLSAAMDLVRTQKESASL